MQQADRTGGPLAQSVPTADVMRTTDCQTTPRPSRFHASGVGPSSRSGTLASRAGHRRPPVASTHRRRRRRRWLSCDALSALDRLFSTSGIFHVLLSGGFSTLWLGGSSERDRSSVSATTRSSARITFHLPHGGCNGGAERIFTQACEGRARCKGAYYRHACRGQFVRRDARSRHLGLRLGVAVADRGRAVCSPSRNGCMK